MTGPEAGHDQAHRLIVVAGPAGVGKSTLARVLGHRLGWPSIDFDEVSRELVTREAAARPGIPLPDVLRAIRGERYELLGAAVADCLIGDRAPGAIVTAPFTRHTQQPDAWRDWQSRLPSGTRVALVWLDLKPEDRWERIARRGSDRDGDLKGPSDLEPAPRPRVPHIHIDARGPSSGKVSSILQAAAEIFGEPLDNPRRTS